MADEEDALMPLDLSLPKAVGTPPASPNLSLDVRVKTQFADPKASWVTPTFAELIGQTPKPLDLSQPKTYVYFENSRETQFTDRKASWEIPTFAELISQTPKPLDLSLSKKYVDFENSHEKINKNDKEMKTVTKKLKKIEMEKDRPKTWQKIPEKMFVLILPKAVGTPLAPPNLSLDVSVRKQFAVPTASWVIPTFEELIGQTPKPLDLSLPKKYVDFENSRVKRNKKDKKKKTVNKKTKKIQVGEDRPKTN